MDKDDIEYLITDIILLSEDIVIFDLMIKNYHGTDKMKELAKEQLQLLYINRDLSKQELMDLGE